MVISKTVMKTRKKHFNFTKLISFFNVLIFSDQNYLEIDRCHMKNEVQFGKYFF
jgi:hypothetical protein